MTYEPSFARDAVVIVSVCAGSILAGFKIGCLAMASRCRNIHRMQAVLHKAQKARAVMKALHRRASLLRQSIPVNGTRRSYLHRV